MTLRVGVAGFGLIGAAVASRLIAAGFAVGANDVDPSRRAAVVAAGADWVDTTAGLANYDVVVIAVFDTAQVSQVAEALCDAATERRQVLVSVSTCDPAGIAAIAEHVHAAGSILIEMPISGASSQVLAGEGVGLVAGDTAAIAAADPILAAICPVRHRLPHVGDGARAKLAINLVLGLNRAALAEGLVFADRVGLDAAAFLPVLRASAAYSQVMDVKGTKMVARDFKPLARVVQSAKDFALIQTAAADTGQALPMAAVYATLLKECIAAGEGEWDNAAIIEAIRRRVLP